MNLSTASNCWIKVEQRLTDHGQTHASYKITETKSLWEKQNLVFAQLIKQLSDYSPFVKWRPQSCGNLFFRVSSWEKIEKVKEGAVPASAQLARQLQLQLVTAFVAMKIFYLSAVFPEISAIAKIKVLVGHEMKMVNFGIKQITSLLWLLFWFRGTEQEKKEGNCQTQNPSRSFWTRVLSNSHKHEVHFTFSPNVFLIMTPIHMIPFMIPLSFCFHLTPCRGAACHSTHSPFSPVRQLFIFS